MRKGYRIILLLVIFLFLGAAFWLKEGGISLASPVAIILYSALLMLAFVGLFVEHFFTRPTDVLASAISIVLLLSPMKNELSDWGIWFTLFYAYNLFFILASALALFLVDKNKSQDCTQNKFASLFKNISISFGNGRFLYFALFILALLFYVDSQSSYFLVLFIFAAFILLAHPKEFIRKTIQSLSSRQAESSTDIGEIFGVHSKDIFLAKLYKERAAVKRFDFVAFRYKMDRKQHHGLIIDRYFLNETQWVKILTSSEINEAFGCVPKGSAKAGNVIYKITPDNKPEFLERLVGLTIERTDILKLRFEYIGKAKVSEGVLLEVEVDGQNILYQVVQGVTNKELLESKDERGLIVGEAVQLGTWNKELCTFEKFGWVPAINTPVYLATPVEPVEPKPEEYIIGHIPPDQCYPAIINKQEAVTHHLGILGVTGTGKSVFARNLIREIMADGTKVICVDFTHEYKKHFKKSEPVVSSETSEKMFEAINTLDSEYAEFKNQQDKAKIKKCEYTLITGFKNSIKEFLKSEQKISIFELPDVNNTVAALDYTRWFFKVLFEIAKNEKNDEKRVCVVLEEAHTVVPESNFLGASDKSAQNLVNSIGQIALQGRKYGIGFMVIAQRTANVSKTVLTQCNSIIAFQQFDRTSSDFLSAYMGSDFANALPRLNPRHAVAVGKAFKANIPMIFKVPDIEEKVPDIEEIEIS